MDRPPVRGFSYSILFQLGVFIVFVILIKGLGAGTLIEQSGGLLTGAAVYGHGEKVGVLEVKGNPDDFINILESKGFQTTQISSNGITTIRIQGPSRKTSDAIVECANIAGKKGQLIDFYLEEVY